MAAAEGVAEAGFTCAARGASAGTVAFLPGEADHQPLDRLEHSESWKDKPRLLVVWPYGTACHYLVGPRAGRVDELRAAVAAADVATLYAADDEFAPFWCPRCAVSYCLGHWRLQEFFDEAGYDYTTGMCPRHHKRTVDD